MSGTNTSSGASSAGPKVSKFAAKSGFVIPKNKLSGSLVPLLRGGKKPGGNDATNEEITNQVQRKTKWGPDLTLDATVRRGRALAYQTRVDQITQQLKSGVIEPGVIQDSQESVQHADPITSNPRIDSKNSELLELERREATGEILILNPSYKASPDYKPLLKEAEVPIPVKKYPGYNFVGLIFGPGSESWKKLEKETGAKIQVYGTKVGTKEKVEISPLDGNETQVAYEELKVLVSADTFEKVDAAVALIELLVTSVSGNLASGDDANVSCQSQVTSTPLMVPTVVKQEAVQSTVGPTQTPQQGQYQYQSPWSAAVTSPASGLLPSVFNPPQNSSAPSLYSPVHVQPFTLSSSTMPSLFGPPPVPARPQPAVQVLPNSYPPINFPMPSSHPSFAQANILVSLPFTSSQPQPSQPTPILRPTMSSYPQPASVVSPQCDRPLTPAGTSSLWSGAAAGVSVSSGPGNMGQTAPPMVPLRGPRPVVHQPVFLPSAQPPSMLAANVVSPVTIPSGPSTIQLSTAPINHPITGLSFASVPPPQVAHPAATASQNQSSPLVMVVAPSAHPSISPILGSTSTSQPTLQPGNFLAIRPPMGAQSRSQHSGPGDFTFKPHHPQNSASQVTPRQSGQPTMQNTSVPRPMMQPPQAPPFQLARPNPLPVMHMFPRPQVGNQIDQTRTHMSAVPFAASPTGTVITPRLAAFSNESPIAPPPSVPHMGSRNFSPAPQLPNLVGSFPPRPGNPLQLQQNYPVKITPPGNFMTINQQFDRSLSFAAGRPASPGQQIYDPFSPTSASIASQQQGGNAGKGRKQETDPAYEDLMASGGLK